MNTTATARLNIEDYWLRHSQTSTGTRQKQTLFNEINDVFAGLFTGILMQLQAATDLALDDKDTRKNCLLRAQELARTGLRQVRELVEANEVCGDHVDDFLAGMETLVATIASESNTEATFQVKGEKRQLKSAISLTLQRILQEAIRNIRRHAKAKAVSVQCCFEEDRVVLEVRDDGEGFTPDTSLELGFGLISMRARVDRLGGRLWLRSSPGEGTGIRVDLPSPYADAEDPS